MLTFLKFRPVPEPEGGGAPASPEVASLRAELGRLAARQDELLAQLAVLQAIAHQSIAGRVRQRATRASRRAQVGVQYLSSIAPWLLRAAKAPRERPTPVGNRVLMLTVGDIDHDPRPNKVARSLAAHGYEVEIMAPTAAEEGSEQIIEPGVRYLKVPRESPVMVFFVYQDEYVRAGLGRSFDYVHANDLTTLTAAWILAQVRGVPLIYDAHELWTENVELKRGGWVPMSRRTRTLAGRWERFLLQYVDLLVTVGPSIIAEFERRSNLKTPPLLLANYPSLALLRSDPPPASIRDACGLAESHFVTLYMGGVGPLRNIESVILAHRRLPEEHVFVVMGPGVEIFATDYRAVARAAGLEERVFFLPPVGMNEVVMAARDADCGIVMLQNICKNFYLFYPNKLFEYAAAALPVAVSDFPDVGTFVRGERCGVTFDPDSPASIASALLSLSADRKEARAMGARGRASIVERHNWELAAKGLIASYRDLAR